MSLVARNALIALCITIALIGTVAYAIKYLNKARIADLSATEEQLSINFLSLETQFSLLATAPCDSDASLITLNTELADFGSRLSFAENQLGSDNTQVIKLKQRYSLLQIRDYLITKQFATTCKTKPVIVLYFYSNAGDCKNCDKAGYALSYLRDTYPAIRVYSFDYNINLGALKTFIAINKVKNTLPAIIINGKHSYGFTSLEDLKKQFPKNVLILPQTPSTGSGQAGPT